MLMSPVPFMESGLSIQSVGLLSNPHGAQVSLMQNRKGQKKRKPPSTALSFLNVHALSPCPSCPDHGHCYTHCSANCLPSRYPGCHPNRERHRRYSSEECRLFSQKGRRCFLARVASNSAKLLDCHEIESLKVNHDITPPQPGRLVSLACSRSSRP